MASLTYDSVRDQAATVYLVAVNGSGAVDYEGIKQAIKHLSGDDAITAAEIMYKHIASDMESVLQEQKRHIESLLERNRKLRNYFSVCFAKERRRRAGTIYKKKD